MCKYSQSSSRRERDGTDLFDSMYEPACEPSGKCNNDQFSFKAYLARWIAQAANLAPSIKDTATTLLTTSAQAAAQACSGQTNGTVCGQKWYVGGYDGSFGVGQQLSALETVQALLLLNGDINAPFAAPAKQVKSSKLESMTFSTPTPAVDLVTSVTTKTTIQTAFVTV